jgi:hypothetical protein
LILTFGGADEYSLNTVPTTIVCKGLAMDQSPAKIPGDGGVALPNCARRDHRQRDIVEDGILMQQCSNTITAVEYLKARGVEPGVIRRVLLGPDSRRCASQPAVAHLPQNSM